MATRTCKGCQLIIEVGTKEGRTEFIEHINTCGDYIDMRKAKFARAEKATTEQIDNTITHILQTKGLFTYDQSVAVLEVLKLYVEEREINED